MAHTTTATSLISTTYAQDILEREVLLVDIIEQANQRHSRIALEEVYISTHNPLVSLNKVVRSVLLPLRLVSGTCIHLTELALTHALLGYDIDSLEAVAIIHTRELGIIAQLIEHLDTIYSLGRQRLDSGIDILTEELLTIDKDLLDGFTLSLNRAVVDCNTRHLLQKALYIGIIRHLKGTCAIAQCIAILRCTQRLYGLNHGFDALGILGHHNLAERKSCTRKAEILLKVLITDECYEHCV